MDVKRCTSCGQEKPVSEFYKKHGLPKSQCKQCERAYMAEYRALNKEKLAEQLQRYREANREKVRRWNRASYRRNGDTRRASARRYYREHSEEIIEKVKQWREENLEDRMAYEAEYREAHKAEIAEYHRKTRARQRELERQHYAENPEVYKRIAHRRAARMRSRPGDFTEEQWLTLCSFFSDRCPRCGRKVRLLTIDHIVPISWEGSSNYITNIQPLCGRCNSKKGDRSDTDYRPEEVQRWAEEQME